MQVLSLLRYLFPRFARKRHGNKHFSFPSGHITCVKQVRRPGQGIVAGPTDRQEVARSGSAMSALGQKRTYALQKGMSALPPKADIWQCNLQVCFTPKADIRSSG